MDSERGRASLLEDLLLSCLGTRRRKRGSEGSKDLNLQIFRRTTSREVSTVCCQNGPIDLQKAAKEKNKENGR